MSAARRNDPTTRDTLAQKKARIEESLKFPRIWEDMGNRELARMLQVDEATIRKWREERLPHTLEMHPHPGAKAKGKKPKGKG